MKTLVETLQPPLSLEGSPSFRPTLAGVGPPLVVVEPLVENPVPKLQNREGGVIGEEGLAGLRIFYSQERELQLPGTAEPERGLRVLPDLPGQVPKGPAKLDLLMVPELTGIAGEGREDRLVQALLPLPGRRGQEEVVVEPLAVSEVFDLGPSEPGEGPGDPGEEVEVERHPLGLGLGEEVVDVPLKCLQPSLALFGAPVHDDPQGNADRGFHVEAPSVTAPEKLNLLSVGEGSGEGEDPSVLSIRLRKGVFHLFGAEHRSQEKQERAEQGEPKPPSPGP